MTARSTSFPQSIPSSKIRIKTKKGIPKVNDFWDTFLRAGKVSIEEILEACFRKSLRMRASPRLSGCAAKCVGKRVSASPARYKGLAEAVTATAAAEEKDEDDNPAAATAVAARYTVVVAATAVATAVTIATTAAVAAAYAVVVAATAAAEKKNEDDNPAATAVVTATDTAIR